MKDRDRINETQRNRWKRLTRIDYMNVSPEPGRIIELLNDGSMTGTASAVLNKIVIEWGKDHGYK